MTRARLTFWTVLTAILLIVAVSVLTNVVTAALLSQVFIACAVFAVGIVVLDFMGILGQDQDSDMDTPDDMAHLDIEGSEGGNIESDHDAITHETAGHLSDLDARHGSTVLSVIAYLRMIVYFCLGFGPAGLAGLLTGRSAFISLLVAIPVGVIALVIAQAFFRFQRSDTDSSLRRTDLLHEQATVTVPLSHKMMGRVRIQQGMTVTEQYALAVREGDTFARGDTVRILRVTDECVYVA